MLDKKPKTWRQGQTIFNFLEWLRLVKKFHASQSRRMADPFHIGDEEWEKLWTEYLASLGDTVEPVDN